MPGTALLWHDALAQYRFTPGHPLNPRRLELTLELIRGLGLLDEQHRLEHSRVATDTEILSVHAPEYVDAVKRASRRDATDSRDPLPAASRDPAAAALRAFGLGTADVPIVPGMHDAAARIAGATLRAAELVMDGSGMRAFSIAGGLHHAHRAMASGFCVYNDIAVAIRWMQRAHSARVLYVDIDAHHGDGVQSIFWEEPDVLTVSFHESGAFLFPGTGFIDEKGAGDGYGMCVNVPLHPHTGDVSFLAAVRQVVPPLAEAFRPDVVVLQAGCDAHALDPLTDLRCTTSFYEDVVRLVRDVADVHCAGRLLVTGGGGYAIHAVVPRAWTLVWATLCGIEPPDAVPAAWLAMVRDETDEDVPRTLRDTKDGAPTTSHDPGADATNRQTVDTVRRRSIPLVTGWGLHF